ncbi:MAG: hypothetical protein V3T24_03700, partial [Longimicrobiales bacterium]
MKMLVSAPIVLGSLLMLAGQPSSTYPNEGAIEADPTPEELTAVVREYCQGCHNDRMLTGNLSMESFAVERVNESAETGEGMIRKLRAGMMTPPGVPRPGPDTLLA